MQCGAAFDAVAEVSIQSQRLRKTSAEQSDCPFMPTQLGPAGQIPTPPAIQELIDCELL
jgi:hypothetical protein